MTSKRYLPLLLLLCSLFVIVNKPASALRSSDFYLQDGDWYDDWGINRNNFEGPNGYLPNLAFETLGENRELAYDIGVWFQNNYQIETDRAEAILKYVQTWTEYGYDSDNVIMEKRPPRRVGMERR